ncbi:MAG: sulfatase-like hydrolase/transferase [Myxococcota bacterium]|nr:sulfatase-like hydrolase/transferase [Myxococcota bacterium]
MKDLPWRAETDRGGYQKPRQILLPLFSSRPAKSNPIRTFTLLLSAICIACEDAPTANDPRPNIIVIMTDDQRADTLSYMPNLDSLAQDGVLFERAYANSPVCGPSRASFFSGRRASTLGLEDENEGAYEEFDDSETIAVALQRSGYITGHIGEYINGYRNGFPSVPPGWDHWLAFSDGLEVLFSPGSVYIDPKVSRNGVTEILEGHSIDLFTDAAIEFVEQNAGKDPFFLSVAYWAPHVPLEPHPDYEGLFAGLTPAKPPSLGESDLSDKPLLLPSDLYEALQLDEDEVWAYWEPYLEILTHVDDSLGRILEAIDDAEIAETTLVVFTSDNGFMFGEHGGLGKGLAYEESARIPLVVRYPRRDAPGVAPDLVAIHDLAPTFADYAGIDFPTDGLSLRDAIEGWELPRTSIFIEMALDDSINFVAEVWVDFKRVVWAGENTGLIEEYDLENDPFELEGSP